MEKGNEAKTSQNRSLLAEELTKKLEWYTLYASEEEYDEKAVESILYLLDSLAPLEETEVSPSEEAWKRFQSLAQRRIEKKKKETEEGAEKNQTLPGRKDLCGFKRRGAWFVMGEPGVVWNMANWEVQEVGIAREFLIRQRQRAGTPGRPGSGANGKIESVQRLERKEEQTFEKALEYEKGNHQKLEKAPAVSGILAGSNQEPGKKRHGICGKLSSMGSLKARYKIIAAAFMAVMIITVIGTAQAGAGSESGFFHWLKRDDTGTQMVTSPENLGKVTDNRDACLYYEKKDVPEWAKEWIEINDEFEMLEGYEWQCFETKELGNLREITSTYSDQTGQKRIQLGMMVYYDKISFNTEEFLDYNYVDSFDVDEKKMDIYYKEDETGEDHYVISFYEDNCKYFLHGQDNLEELKGMIETYWGFIKNI